MTFEMFIFRFAFLLYFLRLSGTTEVTALKSCFNSFQSKKQLLFFLLF